MSEQDEVGQQWLAVVDRLTEKNTLSPQLM